MSILIDENTKVLIQGITGNHGRFHLQQMKLAGTTVVAGVTPGKGGQHVDGVPVYNTVKEATSCHAIDWSILFVPAQFVKDAAFEALDNDLHLVIVSEHVPVHDTIQIMHKAKEKKKLVLGPNCPGIVSPGKSKLGIMNNHVFKQGNVGIVSRSGTLTYEVTSQLSLHGHGQSSVVGIGGDPIIGMHFVDVLAMFESDPETHKIVLIGEIGGNFEEKSAEYIENHITKPVVAYIAGKTAPKGKTMGHAGAIIHGESGTAAYKIKMLQESDIPVAETCAHIVELLKKV